jgi:hypothetical protein
MSAFIQFDSPLDLRFLPDGVRGLRLHQYDVADIQAASSWGRGSFVMSPDRPRWSDGSGWNEIFPFATTGVVANTAVLRGTNGKVEFGLASGNILIGDGSGKSVEQNLSALSLGYFTGALSAPLNLHNQKIFNLGDPTASQDAATKAYVDSIAVGLRIRTPARAATTGNITLSGLLTVDGIALDADDVVLVKNQSTLSQNGLYLAKSGAWVRHPDMDESEEIRNSYVLVLGGTQNIGTSWVTTVPVAFTLGDAITWNQFTIPVLAEASSGLVKVGQTFHFARSTGYTAGEIFYASGAQSIGSTGSPVNPRQILLGKPGDAPSWQTVGGDLSITDGTATFTIVNNAVTTVKINNAAVTNTKLANMVESRIKGRAKNEVAGEPQDLTPVQVRNILNVEDGANFYVHPNHTGDVTSTGDGPTTIANDAVTTAKILNSNVTYAKIQEMAARSVLGRSGNTAGPVGAITASTNHTVLRRNGNDIGFGAIDLSQSAATAGILGVGKGGTGRDTLASNQIVVGNAGAAVIQSANLLWDNANSRLSVGAGASPAEAIHTSGNVRANGALISSVATGTAPIQVTSRTRVLNLNVDQLDGADVGNLAHAGGVGFLGDEEELTYISAPTLAYGTGIVEAWIRFEMPSGPNVSGQPIHVAGVALDQDNFLSFARITNDNSGTLWVTARKASTTLNTSVATNVFTTYGGKVVDLFVRRSGANWSVWIDGAILVNSVANASADVSLGAGSRAILNGYLETIGSLRARVNIHRFVLFNRTHTGDEIRAFTSRGLDKGDQWGSYTSITSGPLTVGGFYIISTGNAGDNFTNVGAANNNTGTTFIATGTTPAVWTNGSVLQRRGATQDLDLTRGYGTTFPDRSSNQLDGTATGNVIHLLPSKLDAVNLASSVTGILGPVNGGTGESSYVTGDILFASATNTLSRRAIGTAGHVLRVESGTPQWGQVTEAGIANNAVTTAKINNSAVNADKLASNAVITTKILDANVTFAKIQQSASAGFSVIGKPTTGAGQFTEISASATDHTVLRRAGSSIGFGAIDLSQNASTTGTLGVSKGGTGQTSFNTGVVLFGSSTGGIATTSSFFWDNVTSRLGVGTVNPAQPIHSAGNIRADSQLILPVATGTAPIQVTSTTRVPNLNVDQLDGADVGNLALHGGMTWDPKEESTSSLQARVVSELPQNVGTRDFSVWVRFQPRFSQGLSGINDVVFNISSSSGAAAVDGLFMHINSGNSLNVRHYASDSVSNFADVSVAGFLPAYANKVVDVVVTRVGQVMTVYVDGAVAATATNAIHANDVARRHFFVGYRGGSTPSRCNFYRAALFNRALSAADVQSLIVNGVAPEDQWGTQTQLINASTLNGSFETAGSTNVFSSWSQTVNGSSTINRDTVVFNAGAASCRFDIDSANSAVNVFRNNELTVGKRYRISFDFRHNRTGTYRPQFNLGLSSDITSFGTPVSQNTWQRYTYEGVAETGVVRFTRPFSLGTDSSQASAWYDDVIVERIGAVIDLDLSIGFGSTFPDRSTNNLDGAGFGDIVHLLPVKRRYANTFAQTLSGTASTFTVTHNLGTQDIVYSVRNPSNNQPVIASVVPVTLNTAEVRFGSSVAGSNYRVVITGA